MKRLVILLGFLWAPWASAHLAAVEIYPLNYQTRFERTEEQQVSSRSALSFAAGASKGVWGFLVEHSRYNSVSGTEYASLIRTHQETLLWIRREFHPLSRILVSLAAGGGFSQDSVETRFGEDMARDLGQNEWLGALSAGTGLEIQKTLRISLEGRLFFGGGFSPNPQPDLVLRTGFRF